MERKRVAERQRATESERELESERERSEREGGRERESCVVPSLPKGLRESVREREKKRGRERQGKGQAPSGKVVWKKASHASFLTSASCALLASAQEGRYKATWKRGFKLPWREAGPPNHLDDKVDSD